MQCAITHHHPPQMVLYQWKTHTYKLSHQVIISISIDTKLFACVNGQHAEVHRAPHGTKHNLYTNLLHVPAPVLPQEPWKQSVHLDLAGRCTARMTTTVWVVVYHGFL